MRLKRVTRTLHFFWRAGTLVEGGGPSMDPHLCGDPNEPCFEVHESRIESDWETHKVTANGGGGESPALVPVP